MQRHRTPRRLGALRRAVAPWVVAALLLAAVPAPALAEETDWAPQLSSDQKPGVPRLPVQFTLPELVTEPAPQDLDFSTVRLHVPAGADPADYLTVSEREIEVPGGVWQATESGTVVFTPAPDVAADAPPVAFSVSRRADGDRSVPVVVDAEYPDVADHEPWASQGQSVTVDLLEGSSNIEPGTVRLLADGLPAGSSATLDGTQAVVADQGVWTLSPDGTRVRWEPDRDDRGPVAPLRYTGDDAAGQAAAPAEVRLRVPSIDNITAAAPWGAPVRSDLAAVTDGIDPGTLVLEPVGGGGPAVTDGGTRLVVPGQGTWVLDREAMQVVFHPESAEVRHVTPVQLRGGSANGRTSLPSTVTIAYPELVDRYAAATPGSAIRFDPLVSSSFVASETLRLAPEGQPSGAAPDAEGTEMTVPGQGVWTVDAEAGTVVFRPGTDTTTGEVFTGRPDPAVVVADGSAGHNTATASLYPQYAAAVPLARTDEVSTTINTPVRVDLLANDQPGSASTTLVASSIAMQSVAAHADSGGRQLDLPGQGAFSVDPGGILTFVPETGFTGTTSTVSYTVEDSQGITVSSSVTATVREVPADVDQGEPAAHAGVADLVDPLRDPSSDPFLLYVTIMLLLGFAGGVAVVVARYLSIEERKLRES